IDVPDTTAAAACDEAGGQFRILIVALCVRVTAAGDQLMCKRPEMSGLGKGARIGVHVRHPVHWKCPGGYAFPCAGCSFSTISKLGAAVERSVRSRLADLIVAAIIIAYLRCIGYRGIPINVVQPNNDAA